MLAIFATVILVAVAPSARRFVTSVRTRSAVAELVEKVGDARLPAARFSALHTSRALASSAAIRGRRDADQLTIDAQVGTVLSLSSSVESSDSVRIASAAHIIGGKPDLAIAGLERALVKDPADASIWNDLAAARYEKSNATDDVELLLDALVAVDQSLRVDAAHPDALYNRALILDRLGLSIVAADAWRRCLDVTQDPDILAEARKRLKDTDEAERASWKSVKSEFEHAASEGNIAVVRRFTARFPYDVRASSELVSLADWGKAYLAGDMAAARARLTIAETAGQAVRERGETLLSEAVTSIKAAALNPDRLRALAVAHQIYLSGRVAYNIGRNKEAEKQFRNATDFFEKAGSPMASVSRFYMASAIFDQKRMDEALGILLQLETTVRAARTHRAVLALIEWQIGRAHGYRGRWNECVAATRESLTISRALGEMTNVGSMDGLLSEAFDYLGQPAQGWKYRVAGFRTMNATADPLRWLVVVAGGSRVAMRLKKWDLAASLIDLEMWLATQRRDPASTADALTRLFLVESERKQIDARNTALARARIAVAHAGEQSAYLTAVLDQTEAIVTSHSEPQHAIELFTRALDFSTKADRQIFVADLLRDRGRAYLMLDDEISAARDFSAGLEELESQRGAADLNLRSRMLDTAEDLFAEATALQVRRGDADAAFRVAERARGRELLDVVDKAPIATVAEIAPHLDQDTALIEYVVLPEQLVIFTIRNGALRMRTVSVKASELTPERKDLYTLILKPVEEDIATARKLIIIPDKILQRVPFNRYLINTHVVEIAPSASVLAANKPKEAKTQRSVLIVGNPAPDPDENLEALPAIEDEVDTLGRIYRPARTLFGPDATKSRFIAEAPNYDVIHFSGHGLSDEKSLTASLLFASGRMYLSDIAKLRLPRAPLVVLAACGTLRGKAAGVEGMPSLARSFLAAGASTVVGTLWDIDDAKAAPLLESFHRHIVEGDSPAAALRSAQLEAIARGGDDAKPKNWAAFVVYTTTP